MNEWKIANSKEHKVEDQWHYEILTEYGFTPTTKTGTGFVRKYEYVHPSGRKILCHTGASADYWTDPLTKASGYWGTLEPYLKSLKLRGE